MRIDALSIQAVVCLFYDFPCLIHASIGEYSIVLNRIFQPILTQGRLIHPMVYIAIKGLYTLLSRCIDPWNNRKVWVDNYFSDDQLIFFLFGQEETITQDHHICQHNQSTSSHSHGSIWKGCFLVIYWLLAELLRFSCLSQIRKKMISFVNYNIEFK